MREAYIYDAVRTPRGKGKANGALHSVSPIRLLETVFRGLEKRGDWPVEAVGDVILGCVSPIGEQGGNIARTGLLLAGWPESVPGLTLNRYCASGLEAVHLAGAKVIAGQADLVVAGGVESMSRVPMGSDGGVFDDRELISEMGLVPQGISADLIATIEGFDREQLDRLAVASQQKAAFASENGYFAKSLIPVKDAGGQLLLDRDETIRGNTTTAVLAELNPSFAKMGKAGFDALALRKYPHVKAIQHLHHAGNSSGIVDGASLVLVGSQEAGQQFGMKARAKIRAMVSVGTEPTIMLTGPGPASRKAAAAAGVAIKDIDLFEINEAFASVVLKAIQDLDIDPERVNVNGGAIAMGHPLGATGSMLLGTALDELERRDKQLALITMCVGAGMGIAAIIERM